MKHLAYLNKYFWKYRGRMFLGTFFIVLANVFNVYAPMLVGDGIDFLASSLDASTLLEHGAEIVTVNTPATLDTGASWFGWPFHSLILSKETLSSQVIKIAILLSVGYLVLYILKGIFLFYQRQTIIVMSRHIEYDLKNEIYDQYQKLDAAFYKRNRTGDLMNRISEDVNRVRMYLGPAVMYTINLIVLVVMCLVVMWRIDKELTLYTLAPLPFMMIGIFYVSTIINRRTEKVQQQQSKLSTMVQESMSGIRLLRAFRKENYFAEEFSNESDLYKRLQMRLVKADALFMPVIVLLVGLSTLFTVYIGANKVIAHEISYGVIVQFVFYVNQLTWPFATVGWVTSLVQKAEASQQRINEFLNTVPEIVDPKPDEQYRIQGDIEFRNVTFVYPESGVTALNNVSFHLKKGEVLGIVGRTGCGKTSLTQLILRMYDPQSGDILIDGKDIKLHSLTALRNSIGYVPQEVFLFSDTIAHNIAFGTDSASAEDIEAAAKRADIHDNIMDFPQQYQTMLGERGINLSGGQKQRVSIARAIVRKPPVLIFDDCLSAVDTETEENILHALKLEMEGRTSIILGHRISSIKNADRIIVLDNGEIKEEGSHRSLLDKDGLYASIYRKQMMEEGASN